MKVEKLEQSVAAVTAEVRVIANWKKRFDHARSAIVRAVAERIMRLLRDTQSNLEEIAEQRGALQVLGMNDEEIEDAIYHARIRDIFERIPQGNVQCLLDIANQLVEEGAWRRITWDEFDIHWEENTDTLNERNIPRTDTSFNAAIADREIVQTLAIQLHDDAHYFTLTSPANKVMKKIMILVRQRLREMCPRPIKKEVMRKEYVKEERRVPKATPINNLGDALKAAGYPQRNGSGTTASSEAS